MAKKILLGLTTITPGGEWKNKVKEIDELGIKEIALFPTCLNPAERKELYKLLENTKLERVPHVHLRSDMELFELDYLTRRFKTEVFNVHSENNHFPPLIDYKKYSKKNIYVENAGGNAPTRNDLEKYAGLCLDLSHWQSVALEDGEQAEEYMEIRKLAEINKIGVNHISAIKTKPVAYYDRFIKRDFYVYDNHWLDELSEVDYAKKYKNYLADIISLELENSLRRQLEVKKYLEKILDL